MVENNSEQQVSRRTALKAAGTTALVGGLATQTTAASDAVQTEEECVSTSRDFGDVEVGTSCLHPAWAVHNDPNAGGELTVIWTKEEGGTNADWFSMDPSGPVTLQPGESQFYELTFAPQDTGSATVSYTLSLEYWNGDTSTVGTITYTGTGVPSSEDAGPPATPDPVARFDLTGDGEIDQADMQVLRQYIQDHLQGDPQAPYLSIYDFDGDGELTMRDVAAYNRLMKEFRTQGNGKNGC